MQVVREGHRSNMDNGLLLREVSRTGRGDPSKEGRGLEDLDPRVKGKDKGKGRGKDKLVRRMRLGGKVPLVRKGSRFLPLLSDRNALATQI